MRKYGQLTDITGRPISSAGSAASLQQRPRAVDRSLTCDSDLSGSSSGSEGDEILAGQSTSQDGSASPKQTGGVALDQHPVKAMWASVLDSVLFAVIVWSCSDIALSVSLCCGLRELRLCRGSAGHAFVQLTVPSTHSLTHSPTHTPTPDSHTDLLAHSLLHALIWAGIHSLNPTFLPGGDGAVRAQICRDASACFVVAGVLSTRVLCTATGWGPVNPIHHAVASVVQLRYYLQHVYILFLSHNLCLAAMAAFPTRCMPLSACSRVLAFWASHLFASSSLTLRLSATLLSRGTTP